MGWTNRERFKITVSRSLGERQRFSLTGGPAAEVSFPKDGLGFRKGGLGRSPHLIMLAWLHHGAAALVMILVHRLASICAE
ncbi:hypothetical protein Rcae01_04891 [Novipirellula caenicola]|uniref:Transposase DDE domain-containing protein n=1 Tax=Novipirellula caenicola TaxID=1536901 RepID=A0ABP9VZT4_9BACT